MSGVENQEILYRSEQFSPAQDTQGSKKKHMQTRVEYLVQTDKNADEGCAECAAMTIFEKNALTLTV